MACQDCPKKSTESLLYEWLCAQLEGGANTQIEGLNLTYYCDSDGNIIAFAAALYDEVSGNISTVFLDITFTKIPSLPIGVTVCNKKDIEIVKKCFRLISEHSVQHTLISFLDTSTNPPTLIGQLWQLNDGSFTSTTPLDIEPCTDLDCNYERFCVITIDDDKIYKFVPSCPDSTEAIYYTDGNGNIVTNVDVNKTIPCDNCVQYAGCFDSRLTRFKTVTFTDGTIIDLDSIYGVNQATTTDLKNEVEAVAGGILKNVFGTSLPPVFVCTWTDSQELQYWNGNKQIDSIVTNFTTFNFQTIGDCDFENKKIELLYAFNKEYYCADLNGDGSEFGFIVERQKIDMSNLQTVLSLKLDESGVERPNAIKADDCNCPCNECCNDTLWLLLSKLDINTILVQFPTAIQVGSSLSGTHPLGQNAGVSINGWNAFAVCSENQPDNDINNHYWITGGLDDYNTYTATRLADDPICC